MIQSTLMSFICSGIRKTHVLASFKYMHAFKIYKFYHLFFIRMKPTRKLDNLFAFLLFLSRRLVDLRVSECSPGFLLAPVISRPIDNQMVADLIRAVNNWVFRPTVPVIWAARESESRGGGTRKSELV